MGRKGSRGKSRTVRGRVLLDHTKIGSKLVPPILARTNFSELSYVRDLLPEVIWLDLASARLGPRRGFNLCAAIAGTAHKLHQSEKYVNFALFRSYGHLESVEQQKLVESLMAEGVADEARAVLECLITPYPDSPMSFFGLPSLPRPKDVLLVELRSCVERLLDKYGHAASVVQAMAVNLRAATGGTFYAEGLGPPDLNALIDDPDSEAAEMEAARARVQVLSEIMATLDGTTTDATMFHWARRFWNDALRLDECLFSESDADG